MAQGNTFPGPNPWLDISDPAYGGKDDALINVNAVRGTTNSLLDISGSPQFTKPGDATKTIAFAGNGIMNLPTLTPTANCGGSGTLKTGTYWVQITWVAENTSGTPYFLGETKAVTEQMVAVSCVSSNGNISVSSTTPGSMLITSFAVYAGTAMGREVQQTLSTTSTDVAYCTSGTLAQTYNACTFGGTHVVTLNSIAQAGPLPPALTSWQTKISTVNSTTEVVLTDPTPAALTGTNTVVWGTDNTAAFNAALGACTRSALPNATTTGCKLHFTYPAPTGGTHTGRFYMATTRVLSGNTSPPSNNIVLAGDGGLGDGGIGGGTYAGTRPTPEIVVGSRVYGVQVGDKLATISGFGMYGMGIEDALGVAFGGIAFLGEVHGLYLDRASFVNFGSGDCIYIDGGNATAQVQLGTIHKIRGDGCKFGIRAPGNFSDIEIDGGAITSSDTTTGGTGIGIDLERDPISSNTVAGGNVRIHDIAIRDFPAAHIRLVDIAAASIVQVKEENINTAASGIGIDLQTQTNPLASLNKCFGTRIAFPVVASFATGISIGAGCSNIDIYKPVFSSTPTTITHLGTNSSWVTDDSGVTLGSGTPFVSSPITPATSRALNVSIPNETTTGTTLGFSTVLTMTGCPGGAPVCAVTTGAQTTGLIGIVVATAGTSGSATIAVGGVAACAFDGSTTPGHYAIPSATPGKCKDSSTKGTAEVFGMVLDLSTGARMVRVLLNIQGQ